MAACVYFPVVIHSEHSSAIDALLALDVPRDEVMDLVVAHFGRPDCTILTRVDGGRAVAAVPLADGRWAAGNAWPEQACESRDEAGRRLLRLCKRGRRGLLAEVDG